MTRLATGEAQSGERHGLAFLEATHPRAAFVKTKKMKES